MGDRWVGEEHYTVEITRGHKRTELLVTAATAALKATY